MSESKRSNSKQKGYIPPNMNTNSDNLRSLEENEKSPLHTTNNNDINQQIWNTTQIDQSHLNPSAPAADYNYTATSQDVVVHMQNNPKSSTQAIANMNQNQQTTWEPIPQKNTFDNINTKMSDFNRNDPFGYQGNDGALQGGYYWRDKWFAILFYITIAINFILAVSQSTSSDVKMSDSADAATSNYFNTSQILVSIFVSMGFSLLWLFLMSKFSGTMIKASLIAYIAALWLAVIMFIASVPIFGIIFLLFAAIMTFVIYRYYWKRIDFAVACLEIAIEAFNAFKSPLFIHFLMIVVSFGAAIIDIAAIRSVVTMNGEDIDFGQSLLLFVWIITFYWHFMTCANVSHAASSGVMATWYFKGDEGMDDSTTQQVARASFKRAITTSFGSICLGSLIEAVIRAMQFVARQARERARNRVFYWIACFVECILNCIGNIVEYINTYAFVQVAIYGKTYKQACEDTFKLFQSTGMSAIVNDDLTYLPFAAGFIINALVTAFVMIVTAGGHEWNVFSIIPFVFGSLFYFGIVSVITSYIKTLFVCWADHPNILAETRPNHFNKLVESAQKMSHNTDFCSSYYPANSQ